jgi:glycogen operon protein
MNAAKDDTGCAYPLGATICHDGVNFSILSASATGMQLVLFGHADEPAPARTITLDPVRNRTSHYWHVFLPGIKPGQLYGYRADGPRDPAAGQRFDARKVLIDPYGKGVSVGQNYSRAAACLPGDNASTSMKSVVADLSLFDWEDDRPINRSFRETVLYEMHVAGFTRDPSSGVEAASAGRIWESSRRFHIFSLLALRPSNSCPSINLIPRTHPMAWSTIGVTTQFLSSRRILVTAPARIIHCGVSMSSA